MRQVPLKISMTTSKLDFKQRQEPMKNNSFFSGFIFGTIFTVLVGGIFVFYYHVFSTGGGQAQHQASPVKSNLPLYVSPAPVKGKANAPVTIIEFADFFCGYCKKSMPTMLKIAQNYPDKVRMVFKNYPLSNTPGSGSFRSSDHHARDGRDGSPFATP